MPNKSPAHCCYQTRDHTVEQAIALCSKRPRYTDLKAPWKGWGCSSDVKHLPSIYERDPGFEPQCHIRED